MRTTNMPCDKIKLFDFKTACTQCKDVQSNVLMDIIAENKDSAIGKKYHFEKIRTVDDFRKNIPIIEWNDIETYASDMEKGIKNQLFTGVPELFIITSGTTGNEKIIPESRKGLEQKASVTNLRMEALLQLYPDLIKGKILPLANSAVIGKTECGIPYGTASGITLMNAPEKLRNLLAYPLAILKIEDPDALNYTLMRFAISENVRLIVGNNAGRLEQLINTVADNADMLIDDITNGTLSRNFDITDAVRDELQMSLNPAPEKADQLKKSVISTGKLIPEIYWPELTVISCWLSGSVGRYVNRIKPLFPDRVEFMDCGYGATEGKFNIPLLTDNPAGPLAIHSGFYEFGIPDDKQAKLLSAHQLEDGKSYEIYCTTYSGLYRYALHDIIKVEGFTDSTPNIRFEAKAGDFANICGEKLSPQVLTDAVNKAAEITGINIKHWCVVMNFTETCYNFCIELTEFIQEKAECLAEEIEIQLYGDGTLPYPVFRKQNLLHPALITLMKKGWADAWYASKSGKGNSLNQIKLPLVCNKIPLQEYAVNPVISKQ